MTLEELWALGQSDRLNNFKLGIETLRKLSYEHRDAYLRGWYDEPLKKKEEN